MSPLLSVVVPFYNAKDYLGGCLASVEGQLHDTRIEFLFVDDGSTDASPSIIEAFCAEHPAVMKLLSQPNRGAGAARNAAIRAASGAYIGFADADDRFEEGMFSRMLDAALNADADVVICDFFKVWEDGRTLEVTYLRTGPEGIVPAENEAFVFETGFSPWNKLIRRKLFVEKACFFAEGIQHEDMAVLPALLAEANRIVNVSEPLYCYSVRPGSSIRTYDQSVFDILRAFELLSEKLPERYRDAFLYLVFRELFYHVLPQHIGKNMEFPSFFHKARTYCLEAFPGWRSNPYVRHLPVVQRWYIAMALRGWQWPVRLASYVKRIKERLESTS